MGIAVRIVTLLAVLDINSGAFLRRAKLGGDEDQSADAVHIPPEASGRRTGARRPFRMGSVARSCLRQFSSSSPSSDGDNGVSTKAAAMRLTPTGVSS